MVISLTLYSFNREGKVGYSPGHSGGSWNCMIWKKGEGGSSPKLFFSSKDSGKAPLHFQGKGIRGEEKQRWENKDR